ncbi:MAG: HAMP domain-containing sensor histidine kinase [Cyclobacteriaceae bacterium]
MAITRNTEPTGPTDPLFELRIETRLDVALAYRQAVTVGKLLDFQIVDQTKIGTSVSEVLRFMVAHFKNVYMNTRVLVNRHDNSCHFVEINVSGEFGKELEYQEDKRISNLKDMSEINTALVLMDEMNISAEDDQAILTMRKKCTLSTITTGHWEKLDAELRNKSGISSYQELKEKNNQLEALMLELENKNAAINKQLDEIRKLNEKLDSNNESLTDFAYTLSHDLKNPLTTLKLLVQLGQQEDDKFEIFNKVGPVVENMNNIVTGLIRIIDVDQDVSSGVRRISFKEELDNLLSEYRYELEEEGGGIDVELEAEYIDYIEAYLTSIVRNLVSNAIKYRHPDRRPCIRLKTYAKGSYIVLSVADNGIGMDLEKNEESLFKPFNRFTSDKPGKGIGLHLIKKMIEKNKGRMEVASKEGEGTTFTCYLKPYLAS